MEKFLTQKRSLNMAFRANAQFQEHNQAKQVWKGSQRKQVVFAGTLFKTKSFQFPFCAYFYHSSYQKSLDDQIYLKCGSKKWGLGNINLTETRYLLHRL